MKTLLVKVTPKSPQITCTYASGTIDIIGRSHPEHATVIYDPVVEWLDEYITKPQPKTTLTFMLEYFNTSSSKMIFEILKRLYTLHLEGKEVLVKWYFEDDDDDMEAEGKLLGDVSKLSMEFCPVKEFEFTFL